MYICCYVYPHTMIYSSELIKGTLKTIVLKLLADNKKMYGYEITQKVKELTGDKIQITEGALYPTAEIKWFTCMSERFHFNYTIQCISCVSSYNSFFRKTMLNNFPVPLV